MKKLRSLPGLVGFVLILLLLGTATGEDAFRKESTTGVTAPGDKSVILESGGRDEYTGTLRVYVAERIGRWDDWSGVPLHNAFLAFALQEDFSIDEVETLAWNLEWDGHDFTDIAGNPFDDIQEDNIKVFAAVFNSASYTGFSDPPSDHPFDVHEVDAVAGTMCGSTGFNFAFGDFTHTVLVEDCSPTW
jgi:hypothetical protein